VPAGFHAVHQHPSSPPENRFRGLRHEVSGKEKKMFDFLFSFEKKTKVLQW
jgi:hypothetical protein